MVGKNGKISTWTAVIFILGAVLLIIVYVVGLFRSQTEPFWLDRQVEVRKSASRKTFLTDDWQTRLGGVMVSVDDDPILGNKDAPITIIEFSDFECPFCKSFFDNTLPQLKRKYIDTGKVRLVYRDMPLFFHEPMATREAIAAGCAKKQGGDEKYFAYHNEIFRRTESNGDGLSETDLVTIATDLGLDMVRFASCSQDSEQAAEVKNDRADAVRAGAAVTPTFLIGLTTDNGWIEGELISGAQPFAVFEAVIQTIL